MSAALDLNGLASAEGLHPDAPRAVAEVLRDLRHLARFMQIPGDEQRRKIDFGYDTWHPEQRQFERDRTGRDLILKPRQIGFTTLELARDLQYARLNEAVRVLIVVHDQDEKAKVFARLKMMARSLHAWGIIPAHRYSTKTELSWADNESAIHIVEAGTTESAAKKRGRSGTVHRLHATEAAFWGSAQQTWTALRGATEYADEVVIESTANGIAGNGEWFHQRVSDARQGLFQPYRFHFFPWFMHPGREADPDVFNRPPQTRREQLWEDRLIELGITTEQLAWWRQLVGDVGLDEALQEHPPTADAAFQTGSDTWIEPDHLERIRVYVDRAGGPEYHELKSGGRKIAPLRVYRWPEEGARYVIGCDPSEGVGGDEAGICVLDHRSGEVCATWHSQEIKPGALGRVVADVGRLYNEAIIGVERNAWRGGDSRGGVETLHALEKKTSPRYPRRRIYRHTDEKLGWHTGPTTRPLLFGDLADAIEEDGASTPDPKTLEELRSIEVVDGSPRVPRKGKGRADDGLFVAWAIAWQVRKRCRIPRDRPLAEPVGPELDSVNFRT